LLGRVLHTGRLLKLEFGKIRFEISTWLLIAILSVIAAHIR